MVAAAAAAADLDCYLPPCEESNSLEVVAEPCRYELLDGLLGVDTDIEEPILVPYTNEMSQNVFKKKLSHRKYNPDTSNFRIVYLVCLPSPSAAHATLTYEEKRSQWTKYCFSFYRVKK